MTPNDTLYFALACLWIIVILSAAFAWAKRGNVAALILSIALVGFSLLPFRERVAAAQPAEIVGLSSDPRQEYHRKGVHLIEFVSEEAAKSEGRAPCLTCFGTTIAQTPR